MVGIFFRKFAQIRSMEHKPENNNHQSPPLFAAVAHPEEYIYIYIALTVSPLQL